MAGAVHRGWGAAVGGSSGSGSVNVPLPATAVEGDLLIIVAAGVKAYGLTSSIGGMTTLPRYSGPDANDGASRLHYKYATAGDIATGYITYSRQKYEGARMTAWGGVTVATPASYGGVSNDSQSTHTYPAVTTLTADSVVFYAWNSSMSGYLYSLANAALTGLTNVNLFSMSSYTDAQAAYGTLPSAGSSGAGAATGTYNDMGGTVLAINATDPDVDFTPDPLGLEVGFGAATFTVAADRWILASQPLGLEIGFGDATFTALSKRQVALTGEGIETPEMTEGGDEGDLLTQHTGRPPSWEAPSTLLWVPLMDGYGNVITDSGSGAAIMCQIEP